MPDELEEVRGVDEVLRDVHEREVVRQEPARERHAELDLDRARETAVVEVGVVEARERLGELGRGGAGLLGGADEKVRLVVADPLLDAGADVRGREVLGGEPERRVGDAEEELGAPAGRGPVLVRLEGLAAAREVREEVLRGGDPVPAQVVDHPPRQPARGAADPSGGGSRR